MMQPLTRTTTGGLLALCTLTPTTLSGKGPAPSAKRNNATVYDLLEVETLKWKSSTERRQIGLLADNETAEENWANAMQQIFLMVFQSFTPSACPGSPWKVALSGLLEPYILCLVSRHSSIL
ncbi:hypothetical protein BKA67DRAFT_139651 [Truncatella angustata]|uniref:Secreted protein n=1 Tax=Truncatella angustata TaxID=152316 RepID=A0A9P8UB90_9PEZI|nr:uncharacterized protein BKA67DRAFT_139651 [Truncatella angustata]KAH6640040.1 hypothetical protein BKA67DRAFT_139651 [Truncatella angustata]